MLFTGIFSKNFHFDSWHTPPQAARCPPIPPRFGKLSFVLEEQRWRDVETLTEFFDVVPVQFSATVQDLGDNTL